MQIIITATMADGTVILETAADFGRFVDLVLSFRRDSDVASLAWVVVVVGRDAMAA